MTTSEADARLPTNCLEGNSNAADARRFLRLSLTLPDEKASQAQIRPTMDLKMTYHYSTRPPVPAIGPEQRQISSRERYQLPCEP